MNKVFDQPVKLLERIEELEQELSQVKQELSQVKKNYNASQEENLSLKRRIEWHKDVRRLKGANSTDKLVLAEIVEDLVFERESEKGELKPLWVAQKAQKLQASPATIGRSIQFLADNGVLIREERKDPKTGSTHIDVAWTEACERPRTITLAEPRKKKTGKKCLQCGEETLIIKERVTRSQKITTCTTCGDVTIYQDREVNASLEANCSLDGMDDEPTCNNANGPQDDIEQADIIQADECHSMQDNTQDEQPTPTCDNASGLPGAQVDDEPTCNNANGPSDNTPTCNGASYLESKDAILQVVPNSEQPETKQAHGEQKYKVEDSQVAPPPMLTG